MAIPLRVLIVEDSEDDTALQECNERRPYRSLGERTPGEFASEYAARRVLTAT
jgi:hypothetical protein